MDLIKEKYKYMSKNIIKLTVAADNTKSQRYKNISMYVYNIILLLLIIMRERDQVEYNIEITYIIENFMLYLKFQSKRPK